MKCYGIASKTSAMTLQQASWLTLSSGLVLIAQEADYTAFRASISSLGGTVLPTVYDSTPLTSDTVSALAPLSLPTNANMLDLATAAGALNPSLSL